MSGRAGFDKILLPEQKTASFCSRFNPMTPVGLYAALTNLCVSSTSDVISFAQNWHHLYLTASGGKDLSNNAQIRVIGLMEPEIYTKMLQKLSGNSEQNFLPLTRGYSMVKDACLWRFHKSILTASKPSRRWITEAKKRRKGEKGKAEKKYKVEEPRSLSWFLSMSESKCVKCDAGGKKGKLSCCQCLLDYIKASLTNIQPENLQNVQKGAFDQKLQDNTGSRQTVKIKHSPENYSEIDAILAWAAKWWRPLSAMKAVTLLSTSFPESLFSLLPGANAERESLYSHTNS